MDLRLLWSSFYFEVLQATTMLFYLLSGIETNRPRDSVPIPGSGRFLSLPGLPGLCISPAISGRSDNDLYGRSGAAARIAFKGWLLEVWDIWEYNYRMTLRKTHDNATPQLGALGDLRHIRNDLLHHNAVATAKETGRCTVLHWFEPGDKMILEIRHVLDFLNQIGALLDGGHTGTGQAHSLRIFHDERTLLAWNPKPKPISVRTGDGPVHPYLGLHIVFDNGLFGNVPYRFSPLNGSLESRREALKEARIEADGNLMFADGTVLDYRQLYESIVSRVCNPSEGSGVRGPVHGPWIRMGR